jgi:hypothetical protein
MTHSGIERPLSSSSILGQYSRLLKFWSIRHSGKVFLECHKMIGKIFINSFYFKVYPI